MGGLISDISIFYEGFNDYMTAKITQDEAFMAQDRMSGHCLGIVAFSKRNNRVSYFGVSNNTDFELVGLKLLEVALNHLDATREVSANVLKSDLASVKQERNIYKRYGFIERDNNVMEAGVPACLMTKPPTVENDSH
ncbi:MAG: GNAT family N-acetyltransferase [Dehalococcoidales bacterium]